MILKSLYKKLRRKFTVDKIPTMSDLGKKVTFGKNSTNLIKKLIRFKNESIKNDIVEFIESIGFEKSDRLYRLKELVDTDNYCYISFSNFDEIMIISSSNDGILRVELYEIYDNYKQQIVDILIDQIGFTPKSFLKFTREEKLKNILE